MPVCPRRPAALPRQGRRRPPASRPPPAAAAALTQAELGDIGVVGPAENAGDEEHRHPVEQPLAAPPHAAPSARSPGCGRRRCRHLPAPHPGRSLRGPGARPRSPPEPAPAPPSRRGRSSHRPPAAHPGWAGQGSRGRAAREPIASSRGLVVSAGLGVRARPPGSGRAAERLRPAQGAAPASGGHHVQGRWGGEPPVLDAASLRILL